MFLNEENSTFIFRELCFVASQQDMVSLKIFVKRNEVLRKEEGYLSGDVLTINCKVLVSGKNNFGLSSVETAKHHIDQDLPQKKDAATNTSSNDIDTFSSYHKPPTEESNLHSLSTAFETLCNNQRFTDVILKVGKHEFPSHKLVLTSRSKVFEAMFDHDMQESRQDTVDLVDMEVDTVKDMLRYIYCGKVRQLSSEEALRLYVAADRYDLQELVRYCRKIILNELSIDNICEIFTVADLHSDHLLMDAAKSLLAKNMKEILKTCKWKVFGKENTNLSFDLLQSAILND
ncbi:uncharacterized protein LOC129230242 [Uloborus diversus]|uniref:uncharacterized protein LOC129230242 n=1 Tax=Uloborus diversus TaxID=327109 RepID=UPI0024090F26|nr:uncharacterized protein LOC129230242 [Uloborus diversus]